MDYFGFTNEFIPAAFLVAGILVMFKYQWQAFFYFMAVIYACETIEQFLFLSFLVGFQIILSGLYNAAHDT